MNTVAIVLAGGSGSRMKSSVKKQYMELCGYPVLYYSLKTFQESFVNRIILVVTPGDEEYCRREIVDKYGFDKVTTIVPGGVQRYHSVFNGLSAAGECDVVMIHDGARAFVTEDILERCAQAVKETGACVAAVQAKDTIKLENGSGFVKETLNRNLLWTIQTPQVFSYDLILDCYRKLIASEEELGQKGIAITDDTMAVETFSDVPIKLVEGSYENIKITTPDDLTLGEVILRKRP